MFSPESETPFFALAQYFPRGTSSLSLKAKRLVHQVKVHGPALTAEGRPVVEDGRTVWAIDWIVGRMVAEMLADTDHVLGGCFGPDVLLVPAPRSAPLAKGGALWPSRIICEEIKKAGLGAEVLPLIKRTIAVDKSAIAKAENRPLSSRHFETCAVESQFAIREHQRIVLVDDVVTRGAMLLGVGELLRGAFPDHEIHRFALIKTAGEEINRFINPVQGTIRFRADGTTLRRP